MHNELLNFIKQQKLFQPDQEILLAVSGGVDSVAMVHLFHEAKFEFTIAHCNFQLRGKESDGDEIFVRELARELKTRIFIKSLETGDYSKEHGISIQMAARDLRRSWFDELIQQEGFDMIATAHHLNDSIETVLFNLTKGTGISGLKGILPKSGNYIRPLMFASRQMILDYALKHHLQWREDKTNSSIKYHRNLIRHKVIPELKKINPNLENTFSQSIERIAAAERLYKKSIDKVKSELLEKDGEGFYINKEKLRAISEPKLVLFELLEAFGFNYQNVKDILSSLDGQPGKSFYAHSYQIVLDREFLFIEKINDAVFQQIIINEDINSINLPKAQLTFEKTDSKIIKFEGDKNTAFLDFERLQYPLTIRKWVEGDWFLPLGMKHKKKLSDFMIDEKIPLNLKKQVLVLVSGDKLVWVIGHRIDDRFKITPETRIAIRVCNIRNND